MRRTSWRWTTSLSALRERGCQVRREDAQPSDVVGRAVWLELIQKPEPSLCEGGRQIPVATDLPHRRRGETYARGKLAFNQPSEFGDRRFVKKLA